MLIVNNTAVDSATPAQLTHAAWNSGIRLADLVFPWFLFCVGAAIPFSAAAFQRRGGPKWRYVMKALWRAVVLVALGCLIDSSILKRPLFDLNVLQLIGLAYFAGVGLYSLPNRVWRLSAAALLLIGYWAAIKYVPVPGIGVGVFEEQRNLIAHINRHYLAAAHLSGLLSTIPTAALVLIGTVVGDALRSKELGNRTRIGILEALGIIMIALGLIWNLHLPFNKPTWTPSYILFTSGTASVILGLFYLIIDTAQWKAWSFALVVFGSNAILAYIAPILIKIHILNEWSVGKLTLTQWYLQLWTRSTGPIMGGWMYTTTYILAWWLVLWLLYRKKIFLKV